MIVQKSSEILLFLFLFASGIAAQTVVDTSLTGRRIAAFHLHGNEKTEDETILREMKVKTGDAIDWHRLDADQKRIAGLDLFHRVLIMAEAQGPDAIVRVVVTERWYIFPVPLIFLNDRDWSKISYGLGVTHVNFRGRAEVLNGLFWLGYNPSARFSYTNPWVGGSAHLFTEFAGYTQRIESKHFGSDVTEHHQGVTGTLGKRFGYHTRISLTLGWRTVSMKPAANGQTLDSSGRDNIAYLGASLSWDHRDYRPYPHEGWLISGKCFQYGFGSAVNYLRLHGDARAYVPLPRKATLALRGAGVYTHGDVPVYDRVYLGYTERIRGHFDQVFQGENRLILSTGLRFPIVPVRYLQLSDLPQLSNMPFGISWNFFVDAGWINMQDEALHWDDRVLGYGCGLHFQLPYIQVFRLEHAWDEDGNREWIADLFVDI